MIRSFWTNGLKAYNLASETNIPELQKAKNVKSDAVGDKSKKSARSSQKAHLELLQEFEFPTSSTKVAVSDDGNFIGAVGVYPPSLRVYDVNQLGLKFARGLDSEVLDFLFLSSDYRKLVFLQADRFVELHSHGGRHHKIRVPKPCRKLHYLKSTAELLIGGTGPNVFRVDLEAGAFRPALALKSCSSVNAIASSPNLPLVTIAGNGTIVESFDHRQWKSATTLDTSRGTHPTTNSQHDVTVIDFSQSGVSMCVGQSNGICRVYDIRSSKPLAERDHRNGLPIVDLKIAPPPRILTGHNIGAELQVLSADAKAVKIWEVGMTTEDKLIRSLSRDVALPTLNFLGPDQFGSSIRSTRLLCSLEGSNQEAAVTITASNSAKVGKCGAINGLALYPHSGVVFTAHDNSRMGIYFVPHLGPAPAWCSFLDSLTEELEETATESTYDDFQFVTKSQLAELGAEHLIGTGMLRTYMHGYFIDGQLYHRLKAVSEPFAYEDYRKKKIEERIEMNRPMRLPVKRKRLPAVNPQLAEKLLSLEESQAAPMANNSSRKKQAKKADVTSVLRDQRFAALFTNPDFAIETVPLDSQGRL